MAERSAEANWTGDFKTGKGSMKLGSGALEGAFSFGSRMGDEKGTNPEELVGAALAGCYTMALNATLEKENFKADNIETAAKVEFGKEGEGFAIKYINLQTTAKISDIDDAKFQAIAEQVKKDCPVAKALAGTKINLDAKLI